MQLLHGVLAHLVERPGLRKYFYDGVHPPADEPLVAQITEMLADAVNYGCQILGDLPFASAGMAGWEDYGRYLIANSPAFSALVHDQPEWYPELVALLPNEDESAR